MLAQKMYNIIFFATIFAVLAPDKNDNDSNTPCYPCSFFFLKYVNIKANIIYSKEISPQ
jgi:hypothetical protein